MTALPDHFDLQVRRAREAHLERQLDFLLGSFLALPTWWFLNQGSDQQPMPAIVEMDKAKCLLVFSSAEKLHDCVASSREELINPALNLSIPVPQAVDYCLQFRATGVSALLVNPGEYAFAVTLDALESFTMQWRAHRDAEPQSRGFWIPNLTSEEEDFWLSHGL